MKKFLLGIPSLLILCFYSIDANGKIADSNKVSNGRSRFYTRFQIGYGFIPNNDFTYEREYLNGEIQEERSKKFSYGKGFNFEFAPGIWINKSVGIEFSVSYVIGGNNHSRNRFEVDTVFDPYIVEQKAEFKANMLRLGPGLIFQAEDIGKGVYPYGKVNMLFGVGNGKWKYEENVTFDGGGYGRGSFEWEAYGARSFGFSSSLGIKVRSEDQKSDFFIEFNYVGMGGNFERASRTKYIINGQDQLNTLSTSQREIVYVDNMDYTEPQGSKEPTRVTQYKTTFSSFGFNMGFYLNIK